jgi:hypothetical protein
MLENVVATKVSQIEADGAWVLGACPDGLRPVTSAVSRLWCFC